MGDEVLVRCEPEPAYQFHCDALADAVSPTREVRLPAGESPPDLATVSRVVISGSTAGVYEAADRPWIARGRELVQRLVEAKIPTLAVCFGHQLVNDALGGDVEQGTFRAGLVEASFGENPLFDGVSPVVPVIHGDFVHGTGDGLQSIASAVDYEYPRFATRHETAPLWTVQFHPELGATHRDRLASAFDWQSNGHSFEDVTGDRLFENFENLAV